MDFEFFEEEEQEVPFDENSNPSEERNLKVRLDKWLWAARFFKTRALARAAIEAGRVYYNGERAKPSREIEVGALLQIHHGRFEKTITIKGLSTRRRSTEEAAQLFEETEESRSIREQFGYPPTHAAQQNYGPSPYPEHHQRRPVRFLRRSLMRQDRNDRSKNNKPKQEFEFLE